MTHPTEHRAKIAEARNVLGEVIARARYGGEPTILMNRGKEAAVIVGPDFYEQALLDREVIRQLEQRAEPAPGEEPTTHERNRAQGIRDALYSARRAAED